MLLGIDVSHHQPTTPSLTGLGFLIARATYGTQVDELYATHIAAARRAGLVTGAYHFGRRGRVEDQLDAFLTTVHGSGVDLVCLDLEADGANPAMTQDEARAFIAAVQREFGPCGLYHSTSGYPDLGQDWRWVADYRPLATPPIAWDVWQYRGSPLDLDRFRGTADELRYLGGLNTMTPAPITDERDDVTIDVAAGADWYDLDNVTKIGAGVDGKLTKYPSPYGVGTPGHGGRRAIIVTLRGLRRVVLVTPAVIYSPASDPVQVEHDRVKAAAIDIHNRHSADELDELQSL